MALVGAYFMRRDPELLRRRMQTREKEAPQRWCQALSALAFVPMLVLPGVDHRFGWSQMSVALVVAADVVVLLSYAFFFRVLRENSYAGRTVEVAVGQQVVQTGPYAVIRHPLYLAVLVLYLGTPLALGSYWSVLPVLVVIPLLVMRIVNEEQVLSKTLPGYEAYRERVRFRLIPYLW
jgi:protein-S-isoprenylcysteine O-methyltransferase Ste14